MTQPKVTVYSSEARVSTLPSSLADDFRKRLGELIELTDEQKNRLKKYLKESLNDWISDTSDLHQRLQDDNDLVEGIIMETDFPWVGASNVHVPLTEIYMDGYRSIQKRSILGAGLIWVADTDIDELMSVTADIEQMLNFNARNKWNIERCLTNVFWTTNRDGLGAIQCTWAEEYESSRDIILLSNVNDFLQEFPSPEESGKTQEEWDQLKQMVETEASDQFPVEVPITFEKNTYMGCKGEIVELVDFVTFPAWVADIKDQACRGYGKRFKYRKGTIRQKANDEVFYEDEVNSLLSKNRATPLTSYVQAKDEIVGIKRTNAKDEYELFELVVKGRLDGKEGEERKYLVTYSLECDVLLQVIDYPYRVDFYALFRIDERPNQLIGKNVPSKTRDLNDVTDTQYNQRINARTMTTAPIFKAQKDMKEALDPELQQNKIRPGMIIWLANFDAIAQFPIQPTDNGESIQEEERAMRVLDMYLGMPASLFSGGVPAGDPQAPGNKTAALINQGNLRMEDPISFLRYGVEDLGDICISHTYQFGTSILEFKSQVTGPDGMQVEHRTLHKKYLRKDIRMKMNGITVLDNPESEMQKMFQIDQVLMTVPEYAQPNSEYRNALLRDALEKGRVLGRDRYLPDEATIHQKMVDVQKEALTQMAAEKAQQQKMAQEALVKGNLAKAHQELAIQSTAKKLAETNLGISGSAQ